MLKKLYFFLLITLMCCEISYGAPAYGTHIPKRHQWLWGIEGNFLIDRNFDNDHGGTIGNRYFITGSYGIFEWLCFDGKIGVGNVRWHRTGGNNNLSYDTNFAGAYGFRIKGYENEALGIKTVAGFQHISVHPEARNQDGDKNEAIIDEWQGSGLISKDIGSFVPYLGARYGTLDLIKKTNEHDRKRIKAERNFGLILGMDYWIKKGTKLNLEGTFLDGEEFAIGITRDF